MTRHGRSAGAGEGHTIWCALGEGNCILPVVGCGRDADVGEGEIVSVDSAALQLLRRVSQRIANGPPKRQICRHFGLSGAQNHLVKAFK